MSTARFALSVSMLTPFQYRVLRGFHITGTLLPRRDEPAVPLRRRVLRAQHGRVRHVPALDQLEQEPDSDVVHVLGQPLADREELVPSCIVFLDT